MTFIRTDSGLKNLHLFHKVDVIVWLEGGTQSNISPDVKGSYVLSIDKVFWEMLFRHFNFTKSIKFKPAGGKNNLLPIARKIVDNNLPNHIVAMDRDYDFLENTNLDSPKILYTYGYNWECDIWRKNVLDKYIKHLNFSDELPEPTQIKVNKCFSDYYKQINRVAKIGYRYNKLKVPLKLAQNIRSIVTRDSDNIALVNKRKLLSLIKEARGRHAITTTSIPKLRDIYDISGKFHQIHGEIVIRKVCGKLTLGCSTALSLNLLSFYAQNIEENLLAEAHDYYADNFSILNSSFQ